MGRRRRHLCQGTGVRLGQRRREAGRRATLFQNHENSKTMSEQIDIMVHDELDMEKGLTMKQLEKTMLEAAEYADGEATGATTTSCLRLLAGILHCLISKSLPVREDELTRGDFSSSIVSSVMQSSMRGR